MVVVLPESKEYNSPPDAKRPAVLVVAPPGSVPFNSPKHFAPLENATSAVPIPRLLAESTFILMVGSPSSVALLV